MNNDEYMKFNAIVGNPPYQVTSDNNGQNRALPIYNKFVQISSSINPNYISMIMPTRWYSGSILLGDFSINFLKDKHIEILHDYVNGQDCFPNVEIKGGICYFLWNKDYNNDCNITSHAYGKIEKDKRPLLLQGEDIFVRYNKGVSIINKVKALNEKSLSSIVSPQNPFGFNTAVKGTSKKDKNSVVILSKGMVENYIGRDKIKLHQEWIDAYKILTPKAAESGGLNNRILGKCYLADSGKCCNGTYIVIGPFTDKETALVTNKYLYTKFCRFLIAMKKNTQDLKDQTFSIVPLQNFTSKSDIDWSKSVSEIDSQLYAKYELSEEKISFIESTIKEM